MKAYKTMLSVVLAIMMLVTMIVPTWAAMEGTLTGGSIAIDNAVVGQKYSIYQILYLESYNETTGAYAYKANSEWLTWLKTQTTYVVVDDQNYVTWVKDADPVAFAKAAEAYATTKTTGGTDTIAPVKGSETATTTTVSFSDLKLGYYLVTTTLGTLCSLDTTNPTVTIQEKNAVPTNEKKVQEDSKVDDTDEGWGSSNDADIGQTVNFQSTITAQAGAENYVFHDKMSAGLTYTGVTGITLNGSTVDASNYTVKTTDLTDDCTFEVVFTQAFCDTLKANDKIVISYTATVNSNAVVGLPGNDNESKVSYGDSTNTKYTTPSKTTTYTWDMDIFKYTKNGEEKKPLQGVKFVLIKKKTVENTDGSKSLVDDKVATVDTNGKLTDWVDLPTQDGTWPTNSVLTTNAQGKIEIDGLDADTYYLREIEALPGFNILSEDKEVVITGATEDEEIDELTYTTVTVEVENKSGTELPSTGGIGTTIFYCAGAILALGAFVLLVTKKRMGRE